jgi:hypothetical protein
MTTVGVYFFTFWTTQLQSCRSDVSLLQCWYSCMYCSTPTLLELDCRLVLKGHSLECYLKTIIGKLVRAHLPQEQQGPTEEQQGAVSTVLRQGYTGCHYFYQPDRNSTIFPYLMRRSLWCTTDTNATACNAFTTH